MGKVESEADGLRLLILPSSLRRAVTGRYFVAERESLLSHLWATRLSLSDRCAIERPEASAPTS
jgi:hypothetical protein